MKEWKVWARHHRCREDAPRWAATLHLARLRAYMAQGRVIALERSCLAHKACEDAPTEHLRASEAFSSTLAGP